MPELPDVEAYIEALSARILDRPIQGVRFSSPFLLRSAEPPIREVFGRRVSGLRRLGKRIVLRLEDELFIVIHLMIAGRLHWKERAAPTNKRTLAVFDFSNGALTLTEAGSKKRASIHVVRGEAALRAHDPGGVEPLEIDLAQFRDVLTRENHTLKRSLTDPRLLSGIGNAYSDEILHAAGLSPLQLTSRLRDAEIERLYEAVRATLESWLEKLCRDARDAFPEKVTAFREEMAVHGRYGKPCPVCATPVQRIVYAANESNYCPTCQTGGRLLADRALSRLLRDDWPRTLEELERRRSDGKTREP